MKIKLIIIGACASIALNGNTTEVDFPNQSIKLIVPWAAGSSTDVTARLLASNLEKRIKQSVIIENKSGADGLIGVSSVSRAKPDGYTLLVGSNGTHGAAAILHKKLPYDELNGFEPIVALTKMYYVLLTSSNSEFANFKDALDKVKKNPEKYSIATTSGISMLTARNFVEEIKLPLTLIPYKDTSNAFTDLAANRVQLLFVSPAAATANIKSGRFKALAITNKNRTDEFNNVPTVTENGINFESYAWIGLLGPKGMKSNSVEKINFEINEVFKDRKFVEDLSKLGTPPSSIIGGTSKDFSQLIKTEYSKWNK